MRATRKAILMDARNVLLGDRCTQGMGLIPDARNTHPGAGNPSNHQRAHHIENSALRMHKVMLGL